MTDTQRLREASVEIREVVAQVAELHDVIEREFGGHTDTEGACAGAIRVLRAQRDQIATLRAAYVKSIQADNEHFSQRIAQTRKDAI